LLVSCLRQNARLRFARQLETIHHSWRGKHHPPQP
jgi:hypothetical protein